MTGTVEGGLKAAKTNLKKYGRDFYRNNGRKGGHNSHTGGFASEKTSFDGLTGRERARIAGAKGGRRSLRGLSHETLEKMSDKERQAYLKMLTFRQILRLMEEK